MRRALMFSVLALVGVLATGCTGINLYSGLYRAAANTHPAEKYQSGAQMYRYGILLHRDTTPGQVGQNAAATKKAEVCSHSILYLIAFGDSSVAAAKKRGGITKVASVDHKTMGILGAAYHQHCTLIAGE